MILQALPSHFSARVWLLGPVPTAMHISAELHDTLRSTADRAGPADTAAGVAPPSVPPEIAAATKRRRGRPTRVPACRMSQLLLVACRHRRSLYDPRARSNARRSVS